MSPPALAHSAMWSGLLILAHIISVSISWISNISDISSIKLIPGVAISSNLPKNGDTYVAPALAANNAWVELNIKVTFVLIPSFDKTDTAFNPSSVIGILLPCFYGF